MSIEQKVSSVELEINDLHDIQVEYPGHPLGNGQLLAPDRQDDRPREDRGQRHVGLKGGEQVGRIGARYGRLDGLCSCGLVLSSKKQVFGCFHSCFWLW